MYSKNPAPETKGAAPKRRMNHMDTFTLPVRIERPKPPQPTVDLDIGTDAKGKLVFLPKAAPARPLVTKRQR